MNKRFKHKYGYLSHDEKNLYLTKSWSWSGTTSVNEKNSENYRSNDMKSKFKNISFLILYITMVVWIITSGMISLNWNLWLIIGLPVSGYAVYKYIIPEIGANFLIPIEKIQSIEIKNDIVKIYFTDFQGSNSIYKLSSLNNNGIKIMSNIKDKDVTNIELS